MDFSLIDFTEMSKKVNMVIKDYITLEVHSFCTEICSEHNCDECHIQEFREHVMNSLKA